MRSARSQNGSVSPTARGLPSTSFRLSSPTSSCRSGASPRFCFRSSSGSRFEFRAIGSTVSPRRSPSSRLCSRRGFSCGVRSFDEPRYRLGRAKTPLAPHSLPQWRSVQTDRRSRTGVLLLSALGVVFGDIGTSPLYALRECFDGTHGIPVTSENVLGVLSLIVWSLIITVSVKYVLFVMRADNAGEGGILALVALVRSRPGSGTLIATGLFGSALLYGDGMITPAISVLSAVEGLSVATHVFEDFIVPITIVILIALFLVQHRGTSGIGKIFGPIMIVWFTLIAVLGLPPIVKNPAILSALNPAYAYEFFAMHRFGSLLTLGSVFLAITGAEALYADMGHFGREPNRVAWFALVLPTLLVNYFGQGALLLANPETRVNPFFHLAPAWGLYPLVVLSTMAAVIASQAIISGAFSMTQQAIQ